VDVPRAKRRSYRAPLLAAAGAVALGAATLGVSRLERAAPQVERASVRIDEVHRGLLVRTVKGPGSLVPRHIRWITADTAGRVERILARPGARLAAGAAILELDNPDVHLQALEAERQLAGAEAELVNLRSTLEAQRLAQEAALATLRTDRAEAERRRGTNRRLLATSAISELEARLADERADELARRVELEQRRLAVMAEGQRDRVAAQRDQVEKLRAVARFRREQVEHMRVRAGEPGVLQELPLELGQWVTPGVLLAKMAQPGDLRAELRIPETVAKDVAPGQRAEIDLRTAEVPGRVTRVAPAAREGTVLVEVELDGAPPPGARADLAVDGTVELERLPDVLYVGRPAAAQPGATVELYRVARDGSTAERVRVELGRASATAIELRRGLAEGDRVVLSEITGAEGAPKVRFR
jgi:multidrug efflux pump subunit AcrA (membrane-fusion protein)